MCALGVDQRTLEEALHRFTIEISRRRRAVLPRIASLELVDRCYFGEKRKRERP